MSAGAWPEVNDRVRVRLDLPGRPGGDGLDLLTRVEDVRDGVLVVAAPTFAGDLTVVRPGLELLTSWATDRGHCRQEFVLATTVRGEVPRWELEAVGDVALEQRRRFVRVPVLGRGLLTEVAPRGTDPAGTVRAEPLQENDPAADDSRDDRVVPATSVAEMVQLSEGGAGVRTTTEPWLVADRQVVLTFEVDAAPVEQLADVLRVTPVSGPAALDPAAQVVDVVLAFVEPVAAADRVRRHVMRIQIENRRRGER